MAVVVVISMATIVSAGNARERASTFKVAGKPWPRHTITYFNTVRDQGRAIAAGAAAWNTSGANIRLAPGSRASADVMITAISLNYPIVEAGHATFGFHTKADHFNDPFPKLRFAKDGRPIGLDGLPTTYQGAHLWIRHKNDRFGGLRDASFWASIAAHEFGHIIGLGHETRGCAAMRPGGFHQPECGDLAEWQHFCGSLLAPDDIRGAVRLYGGQPKPHRLTICNDTSPPQPPANFTAELGDPVLSVALRWQIASPKNELAGVIIKRNRDTCPKDVGNTASLTYKPEGPYGADVPPAGTWCYSIWAVRKNGQPSLSPATTMLVVPATAPP